MHLLKGGARIELRIELLLFDESGGGIFTGFGGIIGGGGGSDGRSEGLGIGGGGGKGGAETP